MGLINEIRDMQKAGKQDREIIDTLQSRGASYKEIADSLAQAKIKEAVASEGESTTANGQHITNFQEMQPSMLKPSQEQQVIPAAQAPQTYEQNYSAALPQQPEYAEQDYQYQPTGFGSDTIAEISEQIVAEKMSDLKNDLEKVLELKTSVDAKIESIEERLQRVEKIIDRLQLSVLQKVGDYITNVEDIKREIIEMEKSFTALSGRSTPAPKTFTAEKKPQPRSMPSEK